MMIRAIEQKDISALFDLRAATRENPYSRVELRDIGITEESVAANLCKAHRGWVCELDGKIAGFVIGDCSTGELWVIAVLPEFEGQGVGSRLLITVETWLYSAGCREFWLRTSADQRKRAFGFYTSHGWQVSAIDGGVVYMKKTPNRSPDPALTSDTPRTGQEAGHC
jgi:ribosomal protein S18 acetylase RimI-like enzyme